MNAFFAAIGQAISAFVTFLSNPYTQAALFIASGVQSHRTNKKLKRGQDILLTKFGTGGGIPVVYGTRRVAGTVVFMETVANKELFVVYALAVGEVESISDLRIDGRSISDRSVYRQGFVQRKEGNYFGGTVASENTVDIGNVLGGAGGDNPRMVFNIHHGATDQEADPMLFHVFDGTSGRPNSWSADHKLSGIAYIAANYEYDTQGMFSGIPNLTAVVKGKKVLDTRTSTTGWSDNPALILYDYLTNDEYGKGIATSKIDTTSFNTAANDCETDVQTITHSNVEVTSASTTTDRVILADGADFNKIKTGTTISFVANSTTYFSGKVVDKDNTNFLYDAADNYARTFTLTLADGAVTTAITSSTTGTITETQDRFETNAVIDTDESVLENTKDLVANMRGIFNYTNGTYSIKVEGTETSVLNLDEDDILEAGIELALENKEQKYNRVEVEFYNSSKNYEADTVVVEHSPLSDDGSELLEHRVQFPHVTNQRIAYNHANAILNRSRNNRTISFVATPKVLKAKVGEVITITSSDLGLSQEQYRITQMTIQPDLNIQVSAVEYQGSIYGWNDPPEEPIETPELPPDPYRVEQVTNLNFVQKSGSTPAYLSWTDADGYTSFEFAVKVYDSTNQSGNVIRDGRVKETRFYLPELPKANGYSAEVISINTLSIESDPTPLNSFDVTVDPVITEDIAQGAVGGFKFTGSKMYHPVDGSDTGTFEISNVYIDDTGQFSLKDKLSFDGTDLNVQGDITSGSTITGATITIDTSASIRKFKASTSLVQIGSGIDEPQLRINTGNVTNALTFASQSGEDGDKVSFALDNGGTITEKAFIKTDTGNASFQNLTFNGNLISGSTTVLTSARQLQNIASLDATTTSTIQSAVGGGTTINNNADNRVITGSNTANTLNGESNLTWDGGTLDFGNTGATISGVGILTAGYQKISGDIIIVNGTGIMDVARNLSNIGTISSGAITSSSTVSATEYHISGTEVLDHDGNYTTLLDPTAHVGLFLGGTGDTGNYYDNNTHYFRTRGDAQQVVIDSTKLNIVTGGLQMNGTTVLTSARQLQNIASLDATTTTTIENAISTSFTGGTITSDLVLSGTGTGVIVPDNFELNATGSNGQITYNLDDEGDSYFRFVRYDVEKLRLDTDVDLKTNLHMNGTEIIDTSRNLTNIQNLTLTGGQIELPINSSVWIGNTSDSGHRLRLHGTSTGNAYIDWGEAGSLYFRSGQNTSANRMSLDSSGNLTTVGNIYPSGSTSTNISVNSPYVQINTASGYTRIGAANSSYSHFFTDRSDYYFNVGITVNTGIVQSYDENLSLRRAGSTSNRFEIGDGTSYLFTNLDFTNASQTGANKIHLQRSGGITFYGDTSEHHGIFSRDNANVEADDILITSYGAIYLDLDSNNNNGSGADFKITRHNSTTTANTIFEVSGENKQATFYGHAVPSADDEHDLGTNTLRWRNLNVGDIQLNNTGSGGNEVDGTEGRWTIQEGAEDLYLINRNTNKKYKFKLEEV